MKGESDEERGEVEQFDAERNRDAKDVLHNTQMEHSAQSGDEIRASEDDLLSARKLPGDPQELKQTTKQANPTTMTSSASTQQSAQDLSSEFVDDASQEDIQETWQRISRRLRSELGEDVFTSWFLRVELESLSGGVVTLSAATRFLRNWIMSHFKETLIGFWEDEVGTVHRLDIRVRGALRARAGQNGQSGKQADQLLNSEKPASARRLADMRDNPSHVGDARGTTYETGSRNSFGQSGIGGASKGTSAARTGAQLSLVQSLGSALDRRYVFDSFCAGAANKVAFEAARSVAMALPGAPVLYNPLYLHGSVGLGKTHLLQAIANQAASTGVRQVVYLTAERFMANFVQALRSERALQFKEQLRSIDLLLIDDMQFLTGKAIQQEFCHMLNALIDGGKQVVVAADRPASELDALEERVRSRLQGGAAVQIGSPDTQLRRDILARRCETIVSNHPGISITDTVLDYVANLITTNGRDLDGALNRLVCHAQMSREPVTIGVAELALADLVGRREPRKVRIEDIQKIVSQHYNVSRSDMLSARRTRTIVLPRQIAMYIAKNVTPRSLPEIGRRFGNRDHTTVLHAVRKIEGLLQTDKKLGQEIELLRRLVED